jgi:hypothetical protein
MDGPCCRNAVDERARAKRAHRCRRDSLPRGPALTRTPDRVSFGILAADSAALARCRGHAALGEFSPAETGPSAPS